MTIKTVAIDFEGQAEWATRVRTEIVTGLSRAGVEAEVIRGGKAWYEYARKQPPGTVVNVIYLNTPAPVYPQFFEDNVSGVHQCCLTLDHPGHLVDREYFEIDEKILIGFNDKSHMDITKAFGFKNRTVMMPHAGADLKEEIIPMKDRTYDFYFSGSLKEVITPEMWSKDNPEVPEVILDLIFVAAQIQSEKTTNTYFAWLAACKLKDVENKVHLDQKTLARLLAQIERISESIRRRNVLVAVSENHSLCVACSKLPSYLENRENVECIGYHGFDDLLPYMGRSRIVLNALAKFSEGSHERVAFGMSQGAVVASDYSSYLAETFAHKESILFLPEEVNENSLADIFELLDEKDFVTLEEIRKNGARLYEENHTYTERMKDLLPYLVRCDEQDSPNIFYKP